MPAQVAPQVRHGFREQCAFEATLAPGAPVEIFWTSSGMYHSEIGRVVRVNPGSIRVVRVGQEGAARGRSFAVPRWSALMKRCSWNNRVGPLELAQADALVRFERLEASRNPGEDRRAPELADGLAARMVLLDLLLPESTYTYPPQETPEEKSEAVA